MHICPKSKHNRAAVLSFLGHWEWAGSTPEGFSSWRPARSWEEPQASISSDQTLVIGWTQGRDFFFFFYKILYLIYHLTLIVSGCS